MRQPTENALGRHVGERACDARAKARAEAGCKRPNDSSPEEGPEAGIEIVHDSEVCDLDLAVLAEEQVARLDVAVDDAALVQELKAPQAAPRDARDVWLGQRAFPQARLWRRHGSRIHARACARGGARSGASAGEGGASKPALKRDAAPCILPLVDEVLHVMKALDAEGMTQIVVTHEMRFARDASDYIIYMEDGHIVEISDEDEIFDNPKDERTRRFLRRFI